MGGTSCCSSSTSTSSAGQTTVKFLCSHSGKILPRCTDGKLRYLGGETRMLSVDRSIPFPELREKLKKLCGWDAVGIRCQLPTDDLDSLVSMKSDDDLANIIEAYDLAGRDKIRAILFLPSSKPSSTSSRRTIYPPVRLSGHYEKPRTAAARDFGCHGHQCPHYCRHCHQLLGHHAITKPSNYLNHH